MDVFELLWNKPNFKLRQMINSKEISQVFSNTILVLLFFMEYNFKLETTLILRQQMLKVHELCNAKNDSWKKSAVNFLKSGRGI